MSKRITITHLEKLCDALNRVTHSPVETYSRRLDGTHQSNIGNFYISRAYGGYSLERIVNGQGGCINVFHTGHIPARELYSLIQAYLQMFFDLENNRFPLLSIVDVSDAVGLPQVQSEPEEDWCPGGSPTELTVGAS